MQEHTDQEVTDTQWDRSEELRELIQSYTDKVISKVKRDAKECGDLLWSRMYEKNKEIERLELEVKSLKDKIRERFTEENKDNERLCKLMKHLENFLNEKFTFKPDWMCSARDVQNAFQNYLVSKKQPELALLELEDFKKMMSQFSHEEIEKEGKIYFTNISLFLFGKGIETKQR